MKADWVARTAEGDGVWCKHVVAGRISEAELADVVLPPALHAVVAEKSTRRCITNGHADGCKARTHADRGRFPDTVH